MPALSHRLQLVHSDTTASIHSSSPVSSATSPPLRTPQARKMIREKTPVTEVAQVLGGSRTTL